MDMFRYDFGYEWWLTYGHLIAAAVFAAGTFIAVRLHWRWLAAIGAVGLVWAIAGALILHGALRINRPLALPTDHFLASGTGRVLDAGAGSGRATLMVLLSRPGAKAVALDIFSNKFGIDDNRPERLRANAQEAGVADRLDIRTGDMREIPFGSGEFDAVVSAYAVDHLNRQGVERALSEFARVLRPNGQFLFITLNPDRWIKTAFPLFTAHGYFGHAPAVERWRALLAGAGFEIAEQGAQPAALYLLAVKRAS